MSKLSTRSVIRLCSVFFMVFFMLSVVYTQAQDTPTDVPTEPATVVPTDVPTEIPTDVPTEAPTDVPTEIPTDVPTEAPTVAPTEATETLVVVSPVASPEASATSATTLAPESPMSFLISDSFDSGDTSAWAATTGWALASNENGLAWQVSNSNTPLNLLKGNFFNVAIQARFLLQGGSAQLVVRQSTAGNYSASIDANGVVGLYRTGVLLQQVQIAPTASGAWRTLRLSAVDSVLRVAVDNTEVIAVADDVQLPTGTVAIVGQFVIPTDGSAAPANTFLADDFLLSVKATEVNLYLTPTAIPTESATETPVVVSPVASPEASATSIATLASEPAMSLLVSDPFDNGDTAAWASTTGWTLVTSENGRAWQVSNSNEPLSLLKGDFFNVAVQARFLLQGGSAGLIIRQSAAGNYTASIDTSGIVGLYRAGVLLQQTQVTSPASGTWQTLRLSAVDGVLRVAVNNTEVITLADAEQLPPGSAAIVGHFLIPTDGSTAPQNTLLADDFSLSVKTDEVGLYATPTVVVTETETPVTPVATATEEATAGDETTFVGKDTSAVAPPSAQLLALLPPLSNDLFANAIAIPPGSPMLPYAADDDTTAANIETGETRPSCGVNVSSSVWFKFTPTVTTNYTLSTVGSDYDTIIAVYTGSAVNGLTQVLCNDDANAGIFTSLLTLNLSTTNTYYIQITGYNGRYGHYYFDMRQAFVTPPLVAPVLIAPSPVDLSYTNKTTKPLPNPTWNPVANAHHYELQIAYISTFMSLNQFDSNLPATTYAVNAALLPDSPGTMYWWRVRALNINNQPGPWTLARRFIVDTVAPPPPNLTAPALNGVVPTSKPVFTWPMVPGASSYVIDVDNTDCTFTHKVIPGISVATAPVTVIYTSPIVLPQGTYCWQVQSRDLAGNAGLESALPRTFSIFIGTAPANGAFVPTGKPMFIWAAVPGATSYSVQLATDTAFASPVTGYPHPVGATTTYAQPTALGLGTYYWRVLSNLDTVPANVGYRTLFVGAAPAAPLLSAPPIGSPQKVPTVLLSWSAVTPPTGVTLFDYVVQVSTSFNFTTGVQTFTSPTNSFTTPALSGGLTYWWRVWARFDDGSVGGAFSAVRTFIVDLSPPGIPTLNMPVNMALMTNVRPTFTWGAATGIPASYRLDVDDDPLNTNSCDFSAPLLGLTDLPVGGLGYMVPAPGLAQGSYCWRVRAVDAAGNLGTYSAPRYFKVFLGTAPANGAFVLTAKPVFNWAGVVGTVNYTLHVSTDPTFVAADAFTCAPTTLLTCTVTTPLAPDTYYWRVLRNGEVPVTTLSRTLFLGAAPAAPLLTAPPIGSPQKVPTVLLSWSAVTPPTGVTLFDYVVQVSTSFNFTTGVQTFTSPTNSFTTPALSGGLTYWWRVWARFDDGSVGGAFSAVRTFIVDLSPPGIPTLNMPVNMALMTNVRPTFTWGAATGIPASYRLDVDDDPLNTNSCDFSAPLLGLTDLPVGGLGYMVPAPGLAQGSYCWRVRAVDAAGNLGTYSAPRYFKVFLGTAPANGAFVLTAKPVFNWAGVVGTVNYTLHVSTDPTFVAADAFTCAPTTLLTCTVTTPLAPDTYYWRVLRNGEVPVTTLSRTLFLGAAPAAPLLTAPPIGSPQKIPTVLLSWSAVTPPTGVTLFDYVVQVSTSFNFTTGVQTFTSPTNSFTTPALSGGLTYWWRVWARFDDGSVGGAFSAVRTFIVDVLSPDVPTLLAPANSSTMATNLPQFTWNPVAGAVRYNILYGTSNPPTIPGTAPYAPKPGFVPPSPLLFKTYYWQVQAVDAAGNTSAFSTVRSVKLISPLTAVPVLNRFGASPIVLSWGPISWVTLSPNDGHYEIVIDNNITFLSPEYGDPHIPKTEHSTTIPVVAPLSEGTWYWRIRACSDTSVSTCGAWSLPGTFTVNS